MTTDPQRPLLQVLREDLKLAGPKLGCGEGRCGACTVLLEGKRYYSCVLPVKNAVGKVITTIEGLATGAEGRGGNREIVAKKTEEISAAIPRGKTRQVSIPAP